MAVGYSKSKIAECLGISRSTLIRRMAELGIGGAYSEITDIQVDDIVKKYRHNHPYTGEREMFGHLLRLGIRLQQIQIRESIHRVDPINTILRWHEPITRRPYTDAGPNALPILAFWSVITPRVWGLTLGMEVVGWTSEGSGGQGLEGRFADRR